ncbi:hypothetical protein AT864_01516 [Anoxybacillus sp. P3H1B]|uniref:hypothetical protein n=1 Tax=Anoxybacillus sp. P3H1B TaxID=1769293 RepID=UPI0007966469|nr:hypothetical protein [Anoxybacillus sp. P3H1B]KXG09956.1 hypothetical protein AT864_01516 [Anoxybacillus sp. P3H1B]
MPEKSGFFDSTAEDPREYTADEFAEYFRRLLTDGIFNGGTNLKVEATGTDMKTHILPGYAWIQGYMYKVYDEPLYLQHDLPDAQLDRIDRIVLRLDTSLEVRSIRAVVLKGEPAANPVAPSIVRENNIFDLSLAQVRIIAGKSYIEAFQITDERLDTNVCGLVNSLIQADTTEIFNEFYSWLETKKNEYQQDWEDWFANVQNSGFETPSGAQQKANQAEANAKAYTDTAPEAMQRNLANFNVYKSGKDANGIFTTVEYKRPNGTLYAKSVLTGGTSPQYTTRTITYYDTDGTTVLRADTYTLVYDADGDLISEVKQ